jgi:hypothetical protein
MKDSKKVRREAGEGPLPGDVDAVAAQQPIETQGVQPQPPTQVPMPGQQPMQATQAPVPGTPFAPPAPGMVPMAWGYPMQTPVGQVMQHGDVTQVEDMNMQTPAVEQPAELNDEEMEVVQEYRKWKKSRMKETSLVDAKKMMINLINEGYGYEEAAEEVSASTGWDIVDLLDLLEKTAKTKKSLEEDVPAPVVPQDPNLAVPADPGMQEPVMDDEMGVVDMDMEEDPTMEGEESMVDELGDVIVDLTKIFKDAGGVELPGDDDEYMDDGMGVEGDDTMGVESDMNMETPVDPMLAERVARIKKKISERRKQKESHEVPGTPDEEYEDKEEMEERVAKIKARIAEKRKALKEGWRDKKFSNKGTIKLYYFPKEGHFAIQSEDEAYRYIDSDFYALDKDDFKELVEEFGGSAATIDFERPSYGQPNASWYAKISQDPTQAISGGDGDVADLIESVKKLAKIKAIREKILAKKKAKVTESSKEDRIKAIRERIAVRRKAKIEEANAQDYAVNIKFPAGTEAPAVSADAAGSAMDDLFSGSDMLESVRARAKQRRKLIAELAAKKRKENVETGEVDPKAADELMNYDAINTPDGKSVTRDDLDNGVKLGESKVAREKVASPDKLVERYNERKSFNFSELLKNGFLG